MGRDWQVFTVFGAGVALIGGIIWASIATENHQKELIVSGKCRAGIEALYQPPPTYVCTSYTTINGSTTCSMQTPIMHDPYMRTLWSCEGGEEFWRKSE